MQAQNYVLILVSMTSGGSGGHSGDYYLLIEKRNGATVEKLIERCNAEACDVGTDRVNYRANEVDLHVGRKDGYLVTAHFRDGALSVRKQKIDPQKPWENETCSRLLGYIEACTVHYPGSSRKCEMWPSNGMFVHFHELEESYPVAKNIYEQECQNACDSGKVNQREFVRKFCHRNWVYRVDP